MGWDVPKFHYVIDSQVKRRQGLAVRRHCQRRMAGRLKAHQLVSGTNIENHMDIGVIIDESLCDGKLPRPPFKLGVRRPVSQSDSIKPVGGRRVWIPNELTS